MKFKLTKRNAYIGLFAMLYISVALVSTIHAISFFALANMTALAVLLACTFEIGQATVLFSILTGKKEKSKFVPWLLMSVLTLVQVLGNVFASYKFLITNSSANLRYFKEPVFIWTDLPDQQCNVILTYIIGSIMPVVALLMTSMLANYLEDTAEDQIETPNIIPDNNQENEIINKPELKIEPEVPTTIQINEVEEPSFETTTEKPQEVETTIITTQPNVPTTKPNEIVNTTQINENKLNSHFVNI